jgi:hypothetical protein
MLRLIYENWLLIIPIAVTAHIVLIILRGYTTAKGGGIEATRAKQPVLYWMTVILAAIIAACLWFVSLA